MKRRTKEPLSVTSFRLPPDVKAFLDAESEKQDRTRSYILVGVMRMYIAYLSEQAKQPKIAK